MRWPLLLTLAVAGCQSPTTPGGDPAAPPLAPTPPPVPAGVTEQQLSLDVLPTSLARGQDNQLYVAATGTCDRSPSGLYRLDGQAFVPLAGQPLPCATLARSADGSPAMLAGQYGALAGDAHGQLYLVEVQGAQAAMAGRLRIATAAGAVTSADFGPGSLGAAADGTLYGVFASTLPADDGHDTRLVRRDPAGRQTTLALPFGARYVAVDAAGTARIPSTSAPMALATVVAGSTAPERLALVAADAAAGDALAGRAGIQTAIAAAPDGTLLLALEDYSQDLDGQLSFVAIAPDGRASLAAVRASGARCDGLALDAAGQATALVYGTRDAQARLWRWRLS